jgi:hypothetical protein
MLWNQDDAVRNAFSIPETATKFRNENRKLVIQFVKLGIGRVLMKQANTIESRNFEVHGKVIPAMLKIFN